ncbi:uncharacterized protein LOC141645917 [Silene latifolia]|uniref:uncharacterized protein LOC141645917 n=1 Tax=Silene latifolia TaxID=37657 RepID=UPI003D781E78
MICVLLITPMYGLGNLTIITGMVLCNACKDGVVSVYDYPLSGINVTMVCPGVDLPTHFKTDDFGIYGIAFEGTPEMGKCNAHISPRKNATASNNFCMASTGPNRFPKLLTLITSELGTSIYDFDPLITQPMKPLSTCAGSSSPQPLPPTPSLARLILGVPPFPSMQKPRSFERANTGKSQNTIVTGIS